MEKRIFTCFIIVLIFKSLGYSCSMFYASVGNSILAGNSEDWNDLKSMVKLYPASAKKYGKFVFGFKDWGVDFCPWGGVNDQGLFYDWASTNLRDENFRTRNTVNPNAMPCDKMLEECSTVEEAIAFFKKYSCAGFGGAHILIGDAYGNSVVIERSEDNTLTFIKKQGNYQVATNFLNSYRDKPEIYQFIQCPRYEYIDCLLKKQDSISVDLFRSILAHVGSNRTLSPTIYSNVYDFKTGKMYIYNYYNFEEILIIDIKKELAKGYKFYNLPLLFSNIKAEYPASGTIVKTSSVKLKWVGDADEYEICISTDSNFTFNKSYLYSSAVSQKANINWLIISIILSSIISFRKKNIIAAISIIFMLFTFGCEDLHTELPDTKSSKRHSFVIENLEPNKKYHWKIISHNSYGLQTETKVSDFTTTNF